MQLFTPICPSCSSSLQRNGATLSCSGCGAVFPLQNSIVDFLKPFSLPDEQAVIAGRFDQIASQYDSSIITLVEEMGCPWSQYTDRLERVLQGAQGKIILDIGCGTSFPAGPFVPDNSIYLGLDISMSMLQGARSLFGDKLNFFFWHIDVDRIPLPEGSVDLILALLLLNVLPDPVRSARQIDRVLRPDGQLFGTAFLRLPEVISPFPYHPVSEQVLEEFFAVFLSNRRVLSREISEGMLTFHIYPADRSSLTAAQGS
jgi:SAM-dependent methyltransferase